MVAEDLQTRDGPVSDVRCVPRADDAATCVALTYDGLRIRVAASIDRGNGPGGVEGRAVSCHRL